MDWVHCNNCYFQPGDVDMKKFFITNCGHIYCDECLKINQLNECLICHTKFTTIPLTKNMNSDVEIYFHDPVVNLKKQVKILEFQQSHRIRLVSHIREKIRNYKALKKENYNLNEELKLRQKEHLALAEELQRVKADFFELKKKYDFSTQRDQIKNSQRDSKMGSFSQIINKDIQRQTPEAPKNLYSAKNESSERNFNLSLKCPSNSDFFLMSESKSFRKNGRGFTTPDLPRFPGNYRSQKMFTPDLHTPPTPESVLRECSQRDPLQRKIKLPGSRSGPSPATRIGFHGLTLTRPTSTPKKESIITNKYLKYFK